MSVVIIEGNPLVEGITLWGPFEDSEAAIKWADCNPRTDLTDRTWKIEPLEEPGEAEE